MRQKDSLVRLLRLSITLLLTFSLVQYPLTWQRPTRTKYLTLSETPRSAHPCPCRRSIRAAAATLAWSRPLGAARLETKQGKTKGRLRLAGPLRLQIEGRRHECFLDAWKYRAVHSVLDVLHHRATPTASHTKTAFR